jgi:outer membrane protein OmpA-like peptidoglycan-associated protein
MLQQTHHESPIRFAGLTAAALLATGCLATRGYVDSQISEADAKTVERVEGVETQVEKNQETLEEHDKRLEEMSETSREALGRAIEAGKLAEGKLIYETVLTDDDVRFSFDASNLGEDSKAALLELATVLKEENAGVYLEIQGHTDSTGPESYNLTLGERRAEAVRAYLNEEHQLPLHRMSVMSYGEAKPIADNSTAAGRAQNRRVTIVVLK